MDRAVALELLRTHKPVLEQRYGLKKLMVFGSVARDTARSDSDLDVLVDFADRPPPTPTSAFSSTSKTCSAARSTS